MSDSEEPIDLPDDGGDDLFGDEDDAAAGSDHGRNPSDADLASDQDQDLEPREDDGYDTREVREKVIYGVELFRHRTPKSSDGTIHSLRVPKFLKFIPTEFDPATFEPTEFDIANARDPAPKQTIRFRRDHASGQLKSNTLIYRWSDGSTTLSVGGEQYQLNSKSFAPPQDKTYHEMADAHYYAAAAHLKSNLLVIVGHITEQYTVKPPKDVKDDAIIRLSERLAAATRGAHGDGDMIIKTTQDPELQKKQAEQAEKERMKAQRRRETAAAKMDGVGRYKSGGLSIGDLEGGRRAPGGGRKRGAPGAARAKRRRPEYDSDDELPQGARHDEYDMEDDFIVGSDEEELETGAEDEEEEELLDDDDEEEAPRSKRQKTADAEDADADAEADLDDDLPAAAENTRGKRRNVIDDDDDDE